MSGNKIMDEESISTLLITANVGSLFEDVSFFLFFDVSWPSFFFLLSFPKFTQQSLNIEN